MRHLILGRRRHRNIPKGLMAGAVGGLTAAYVMTQFQALWTKAAKELEKPKQESPKPEGGSSAGESEDATVKTAKAISQHVFGHQLSDEQKKWAGPAVHYAFGTLAGAAYGLLVETVPKSNAGTGTGYGSALWLAADEIGVPAFGLAPPPSQTPASSHVKALVSHLVFGAATDVIRKLILRTGRPYRAVPWRLT